MADDSKKTKVSEEIPTPPPLTKAQAGAAVYRLVPVLDEHNRPRFNKDGEPLTKKQKISADDVLNCAEYPDRIVVVTTSGEKLVHNK